MLITVWRACVLRVHVTHSQLCACVWSGVRSRSPVLNPNCESHLSDFDPVPHRHTGEEGAERSPWLQLLCACEPEAQLDGEGWCSVPDTVFGAHTHTHTLWSCEADCCFEGANCSQRAHRQVTAHALCNTHSSYSQLEPQVSPLAPGQVDL